ncbi:MAG: DUF6383 domain-containing protein [Paludibacter sp.]
MTKTILKKKFILLALGFVSLTLSAATYTYTFPAQVYTAYDTQSLGGIDWTATATGHTTLGFGFDTAGAKGQQFGQSVTPTTVPTDLSLSTSGISGTISSVMIRTASSAATGTISISVGGVAFTVGGATSVAVPNNNANITFIGSGSGQIVISWAQPTTKKAVFIKTIEVTYDITSGIETINSNLSVTAANGQLTFEANAGDKIQIYNALGKDILTKTAIDGKNSILLAQRGLFIVKVGNRLSKVIL